MLYVTYIDNAESHCDASFPDCSTKGVSTSNRSRRLSITTLFVTGVDEFMSSFGIENFTFDHILKSISCPKSNGVVHGMML